MIDVDATGEVEVSVILPCRDAEDTIGEQLVALAGQATYDVEVLVVDDGSSDRTRAIVEDHRGSLPAITLLHTGGGEGPGRARNLAVRHARGTFLLFCDADDIVDAGWIDALRTTLETEPFVAGRLDHSVINPAWSVAAREWVQDGGLQRWESHPDFVHAAAANLGIRRELWDQVGPFDEDLDRLSDTAYCFRAQRAGYRLAFADEAVVHYRLRHTLRGVFHQGRTYGRASVALHRKFRASGMPRPPIWRPLAGWLAALPRLAQVRTRSDLAIWLFRAGWRFGRLQGSLRHRFLAL